jgi:NAD(P)-dependent dehydrogenase (short-subunit alcohol dehydrogenase family)
METVLITGANRGLGLGLARVYREDGWRVIAVARRPSDELLALEDGMLEVWQRDLTDDDALEDLADSLAGRRLDVLINNAGRMAKPAGTRPGESVQGFGWFDRELWHDVFDINLFTPMRLVELFADRIARSGRGRIVNLSSTLGSIGLNDSGGLYAYRASKAGLNAITRSMAADLAGERVIAVAMHPGWVRTDMGGSKADLDIDTSVRGIKRVVDGLQPADSGRFLAWDGSELPW